MPVNIEIKARCKNADKVRQILASLGAEHRGTDHQIDTYFKVENGRLKLREGNIENNLIYYNRPNAAGPKRSDVILYPSSRDPGLKKILAEVQGILAVVDKHRDIFFIGNVKFHVDEVHGLGSFVEVEAIGTEEDAEKLEIQCKDYIRKLEIQDDELISESYSDMILAKEIRS